MKTLIAYIRRFGFWRGLYFRKIAAKCDKDPHLLDSWATHFSARASREFHHDNNEDGNAFLAFAEILRSTHDKLVLYRKPRRPILTKRKQRIDKAIRRIQKRKETSR